MGKLSWFPKFVLGPALAAALGFWIIGPRLAGDPNVQKMIKEKATALAARSAEASSAESDPKEEKPAEQSPAGPAPQVTVGVKPVSEEVKPSTKPKSSKPKRRRKRRRSTRTTKPTQPAQTAPPAAVSGP
ncbi:hypothetical protein EON82_08220 [bacterium]|nr:MAG: hypothetical protein EON82_08220 [bacterium]